MIAANEEKAKQEVTGAMIRAILIASGKVTPAQVDALDRESERTTREKVTGAVMGQAVIQYLSPGGKLEHLFSGDVEKSAALMVALLDLPIDEAVRLANEVAFTAGLLKDTANVILVGMLSKRA